MSFAWGGDVDRFPATVTCVGAEFSFTIFFGLLPLLPSLAEDSDREKYHQSCWTWRSVPLATKFACILWRDAADFTCNFNVMLELLHVGSALHHRLKYCGAREAVAKRISQNERVQERLENRLWRMTRCRMLDQKAKNCKNWTDSRVLGDELSRTNRLRHFVIQVDREHICLMKLLKYI